MRAGPIGLLPNLTDILQRAEIQAQLTHNTPDGIESAQAAALAVHYCHHRIGPTAQLPAWVHDQLRAYGRDHLTTLDQQPLRPRQEPAATSRSTPRCTSHRPITIVRGRLN